MNILVTGAFGWTAQPLIEKLAESGHSVIALDLPSAERPQGTRARAGKIVLGDVSSYEDVHQATSSAEAIMHLAVATGPSHYETPDTPFAVNVKGTYNVFASARTRGITDVVLISSAAVHIDAEKCPHDRRAWKSSSDSDHLYDLTKRLQEEIARDFSETFGLRVSVLRAGHIVDGRKGEDPHGTELSEVDYLRGGWVCRYDLADACLKALELRPEGYAVYHVIGSRLASDRFDIARTERELGMSFQSRFEEFEP